MSKPTDRPEPDREWQHAACLSIAAGRPGWDQAFGERASPAMLAVQALRKERNALCEMLDSIARVDGVEVDAACEESLADAVENLAGHAEELRVERDFARAEADQFRFALAGLLFGGHLDNLRGGEIRDLAEKVAADVSALRAERDTLRAALIHVRDRQHHAAACRLAPELHAGEEPHCDPDCATATAIRALAVQ